MLDSFRENSQGIVAKVIVGFIVVTFALWGVESLVSLGTADNAPVIVNGVDLSENQIQEGIDLQRRQLMAQMGDAADPALLEDNMLRGSVVEGLIEQELLVQSARELGLRVSSRQLDSIIVNTKEFQVDGRFDKNQFSSALRNVGLTPLMYRDYLSRDVIMAQGRSGLTSTAFTLPGEAQRLAELDRQTRDVRQLNIDVKPLLDTLTATDADIDAFYQANLAQFVSPEQVAIDYLLLDKAAIAQGVAFDESELQGQYDRLLATFESEEARQAAHILVAIGDDGDWDAAKTKAQALAASLKAGADFAELARESSDDTGSAEQGGDLGFIEKDVMVPEFEDVLYALAEGEVSAPVETEFGYHLIKLLAIDRSEAPSFDEARSGLIADLRQQKAEALFVTQAEALADISFSSADLIEPAEVLGLTIQKSALFDRSGSEDPIVGQPRVLKEAFSSELIEGRMNSDLIELSSEQAVVIRVREHHPEQALPLATVREQVMASVVRQKAAAAVKAQAQQLLTQAREHGLDGIDASAGRWDILTGLGRGDQQVSREVKSAAFAMPRPSEGKPSLRVIELADGSAVLVAVEAVNTQAVEMNEDQQRGLEQFLTNRAAQSDYRQFVQSLRSRAEIERF